MYAGKPLEPESPKERKEHAKKIILKMKNTNALEKQAFDEVLETLRESPKHSHKKTETSSLNDLTNSIKKIEEEWEKKTKKPKIKIMIKKNAKHKSDDMTPISGSMTPLSSTRKKFLIGTPIFTPRSSMSKVMFKSSSCTSLDKIISITPRVNKMFLNKV